MKGRNHLMGGKEENDGTKRKKTEGEELRKGRKGKGKVRRWER